MPHFLSQRWLAWPRSGFGSRADSAAGERDAWIYRCAISLALVGAEFAFLHQFFYDLWVLPIGILVHAILPRPHVRLPLFAARLFVMCAAVMSSETVRLWFAHVVPASTEWHGNWRVAQIALWFGLGAWAFFALRTRARSETTQTNSTTQKAGSSEARAMVPKFTLANVGGLQAAKAEIVAFVANRLHANQCNFTRNGILFYGPQGTGKNLLAEAIAGEFRAKFFHVRCAELVGPHTGTGAERIRRVFDWARSNVPLVLFLDEVDAIGSRKQLVSGNEDAGGGGREYNSLVTQLMQSIDEHRATRGFLIVAATNHIDALEPSLIRDGRFDLKIRLDLPCESERLKILEALLAHYRLEQTMLVDLAKRTPGWSPARLRALGDRATALASGKRVQQRHLIEALEKSGGRDQDPVERVGWSDVVLPESVSTDLRSLLALMAPGRAEALSLPVPSGLILIGPPGTGKTTVARLIASEANRSFYSISPSDVLGAAVGGSVRKLSEVFRRAKENAPSILFFDEMDGLFPNMHGQLSQHDVQLVEQALMEISALKPEHQVFLMGTTNHLDRIDLRILRGGRFSEKIEMGVPDAGGYRHLVLRYLGKARLQTGWGVDQLVARVDGMAPADVEALVTSMKRAAMRRMLPDASELPPLAPADFEEALIKVRPRF